MANFNEISKKYENDSVIQKSASEILFELLEIQPNDDVLDLGCGTGHISRLIRDYTHYRLPCLKEILNSIKSLYRIGHKTGLWLSHM